MSNDEYVRLTVESIPAKIDEIIELYDKGDDTIYIIEHEGKEVLLTPYNGPYTETVKETDDGAFYVEIPQRILSKQGWSLGDDIVVREEEGKIILTKNEINEK